MRRGPKFKKLGRTVAAATIGENLVNLDLWITTSLSNRLFNNKINMLNSSRCMDFPNGRYMNFESLRVVLFRKMETQVSMSR